MDIKKKVWAWTIISIMFVVMIVILVAKSGDITGNSATKKWEEKVVEGTGDRKIVQLFIDGEISGSTGILGRGFSSSDILSQLNQVMLDDTVKGVVIRVNSPGGEVVATNEIYHKIEEVKKKGKPVVISMGAYAASGGYYLSAVGDYIYANPATITGSLGVIFSLPNYQKAADWIGYSETVIKSGAFKDIGNAFRPMSEEERAVFQRLVDESYQEFVDVIAKGRNIPREQVLKIADGRVYSGKQAKELKLIDEFGTLEDATNYTKRKLNLEEARVVSYTQEERFMA
ncbi:signal peptide peptidase SppA [Brevibacillus formosus]